MATSALSGNIASGFGLFRSRQSAFLEPIQTDHLAFISMVTAVDGWGLLRSESAPELPRAHTGDAFWFWTRRTLQRHARFPAPGGSIENHIVGGGHSERRNFGPVHPPPDRPRCADRVLRGFDPCTGHSHDVWIYGFFGSRSSGGSAALEALGERDCG